MSQLRCWGVLKYVLDKLNQPIVIRCITLYFGFSIASEQAQAAEESTAQVAPPPATSEERLSPRAEMRLALDQGKDMLADQVVPWVRLH